MPNSTLKTTLCCSAFILGGFLSQAQDHQRPTTQGTFNYTGFTSRTTAPDPHWLEVNKEYAQHPDARFRIMDLPQPGAVEVISKRTRDTRYFIDPQHTNVFWQDKSSGPLNYQKNGQWLALDAHLQPAGNQLFEASHQDEPVGLDLGQQQSYIRTAGGRISFNKWELYGRSNGTVTRLATANWNNYTIGEDGMRIVNIFPGIDAEMHVTRGTIKTNFIVHQNNFPAYDQLIFRDHFQHASGGSLAFADNLPANTRTGDVRFRTAGKDYLQIDRGIAYTTGGNSGVTELKYTIDHSSLSIPVDAAYIASQLAGGNDLIIDPTVVSTATLALANITGSMNCGSSTNSCNYTLAVPMPVNATVTKVYNRFSVQALSPAVITNAFFGMQVNSGCGYFYNLTLASTGIVGTKDTGSSAIGFDSVTSLVLPCIPAPSCTPAPIVFTLRLWNTYCAAGPSGCSNVYVRANEDFVVRILGASLEATKITRSSNTIICAGSPVTLSRNATFGVPPYTYSWAPGGQTTPSITVTPSTTTLYTSTVTDACGNRLVDTTTVVVQSQFVPPTVVTPQTVCQYGNVPLTAVGPNLRWWTTATGGVASTIAPTPPNVPGTYNYYVSSITLCGETPRAQITVTVLPKPAPPTVVSPVSYCQFAQVQLTATGQNLKWYQTPTGGVGLPTLIPNTNYVDSFYYYVSQTVNGCESDRARIRVYVNYKPNGIVLASRLFVCEGDTASFRYYGNALPDAAYNWSVTGGSFNSILSGQGGQGPVIIRFDSAGLRDVRVQVNNRGCLSDIATQTVSVRPNPKITFVAKQEACQNEVINVALSSISPQIDSFHYSFPNAQIVYGANSGGPYGIRYANAGSYVISSKSYSRECPSRLYYDTITVRPLPDARFTISKNEICVGDSVLFTASRVDSNTRFYWTPDNFFATGNISPAWGVVKAGGYVKLRQVSQYGCESSDSLFIKGNACCEMFFPNAFSPNNDGRNDVFRPVTLGHQDIKTFRIFNRWGQVVYETRTDRAGWNGVYNGKDQDNGTYYYYIRYRCQDSNEDFEQKGELILVR